ncbi:MAG: NAD(P)/FAD-dependent oxidoreductase [Chloroflexota bacterium]|nr:FAD-binding oxidoreductase [Chloroflexota bacterium]MBI5702642.1 FAD-binding oxidoreductase [Chloroflexota bacterium]
MNETYDAIVIGAGVIGASVAYHLSKRGLKVLILERRSVGAGATGASSGLVRMHYDVEVDSALAWESFQFFHSWRERIGGECGFHKTGFLQIVAPEKNEHLRANVAMHKRLGIITDVVTAEDVKKIAPMLKTDDFELAAYEPESGYADPVLTTNSFLEQAKARGAVLMQNCEVTGIRVGGGKVQGVESGKGSFDAPIVVNCAGTFAGRVARLAGVEIPLDTWTHDVAFVKRPPQVGRHPTVIDDALAMYFRPEGELTLVALEDGNRMGEPPEAELGQVDREFVMRAIDRICQRVEGMEAGALHSTHVGRDGLTPDQRAVLDQAGPAGFYVACGFSGTGFKLSPAVGVCMSELILDGRAKLVDISSLTLKRFARGEFLRGEHSYGDIWR